MAKKISPKVRTSITKQIKKAAKTGSGNVHVVPRGDQWAIKKAGSSKASKIVKSKETAIRKAKSLKDSKGRVIVHSSDGHFIKK